MTHERIKEHITGLLSRLGYAENDIAISYDDKTNTLWFSLPNSAARILLAREGEALSALNHVVTKLTERILEEGVRLRVVVDANNHERQKIENLRTVAHMMAERARYFKSSIDIEPMLPYERRIVHEFLSEMPDIVTESVGEGKARHIVIRYKDPAI